jgi:hypothetical protein
MFLVALALLVQLDKVLQVLPALQARQVLLVLQDQVQRGYKVLWEIQDQQVLLDLWEVALQVLQVLQVLLVHWVMTVLQEQLVVEQLVH